MSQSTVAQLMDQAIRHHQAGRLAEAEQLYRQILALQPDHADALHLLGVMAYQVGQYEPAIELISRAIALNPSAADFYCNLGNAYQDSGRVDDAIAAFGKAVELRPSFAEAHNNRANALVLAGKIDDAIACSREAIKVNPKYPQAYNSLGTALRKKGLPEQSVAALRKALSLKPNYAEAFNNLGNVYRDTDQLNRALEAFRGAASLKPDLAEIQNNLAGAYEQQGSYPQAIDTYRKAALLPTATADIHVNLGIALLREGDFIDGWREYEWRWRGRDSHREFRQPQWDGAELKGRRILIHAEQGLGDTIQFARYLPAVAARGGRIIVQCQRELIPLLKQINGIESFISQDDADPDFDVQCAFLSLPHVLGTTLETIPTVVPYLPADPELSRSWRARISKDSDQKLHVGLIWSGRPEHKNDRNRSMRLADLAPLAQVQNIQFHSLQKGPAAAQLRSGPPGLDVQDWESELRDFSQTAALMENLDLIVSVDTAAAHLAGALGKSTLLLLPFVADWRWLRDRGDSPWYPTMRLLRQRSRGEWEPVVAEAARLLAREADHKLHTYSPDSGPQESDC